MDSASEEEAFIFRSTSAALKQDPKPDSKFYVVDHGNTICSLFIGRNTFTDCLIHGNNDLNQFSTVYTTRQTERIFSASALPSKKWYLIVLLLFGDGINPRPCYRSIFVDYSNGISKEFPISAQTYTPQLIEWNFATENPSFFHTTFNNTIRSYDLFYEGSTSFKVTPKKISEGQWFCTSMVGQTAHTYMIQPDAQTNNISFSDQTRIDLYPKVCYIPQNIVINSSSEFKVYQSSFKRQSNNTHPRCFIHSSPTELTIILPLSSKKCNIPLDYINNPSQNENEIKLPGFSVSDLLTSKINFNPLDIQNSATTKFPFMMFNNEFGLVAAPKGYMTGFLIDHKDRVRASFCTAIPKKNEYLHKMNALTDNAALCMYQADGKIYKCDVNPKFFVERDPRFLLPVLHTIITQRTPQIPDLRPLITENLLTTFWNCEVFNEILLLYFNAKLPTSQRIFAERICSTFIDSKRFKDSSIFLPYLDKKGSAGSNHYKSFSDLSRRISRQQLDLLPPPLQDPINICEAAASILEEEPFNINNFDASIKFPAFIQIFALKQSLSRKAVIAHPNELPHDIQQEVVHAWAHHELVDMGELLPAASGDQVQQDGTEKEKAESAERLWWFIRTEKIRITETQEDLRFSNLFMHIEQVTNKTSELAGGTLFNIHQYMLGIGLNEPIVPI